MSSLVEITLGIMTAMGGFVDISELVFAAQAGSRFQYSLLWAFVLGTIAIIIFGEMSGRVAAIARRPVFNLMRQRLGLRLGLLTLVAATLVNVITCAAEISGLALILQLAIGWPHAVLAVLSTLGLIALIWLTPFKWIERSVGLLGLFMIIFIVVTLAIQAPLKEAAAGLIPSIPPNLSTKELLTYGYFVVAILSTVTFPYEVYFYSSGAIEESWGPKDLLPNRLTTFVGFSLGSLLALAIVVNSAVLFAPLHIDPKFPGTVALQAAFPFGQTGVFLALAGMFFAIAGAAIETCLSASYGLSQFFGWEWGRYKGHREAPLFMIGWLATFVLSLAIVLTGIKPLDLIEYAIISSILLLPLTYLPVLLIANEREYMGVHVNGRIMQVGAWSVYAILVVAAVAALPLFFITSGGKL
jgi:Mn2+/Fe2+ NRAMP family transporter